MKHITNLCFAGLLLVFADAAAQADASTLGLGVNLISNPGAEFGSSLGNEFIALDDWLISSGPTGLEGFAGVPWGNPGGFPTLSDPGPEPSARENYFFAGGADNEGSSAQQHVNGPSTAVQAAIDLGTVRFDLNGWLGGFTGGGDFQEDNAVLSISFLNAESGIVGSAEIGPVTSADRGHQTGLVFREQSGIVPAGTRTIDVKLKMTRYNGTYNDGYADNLSLILLGPAPYNIFQWTYINPQDASQGKQESSVLTVGGYGLRAEPGLVASNKNLTKAYLIGADLRNANLTNSNLTDADLGQANLTNTNFGGANLTRANLYQGNLTTADLRDANLTGANLNQAVLNGAQVRGGNFASTGITLAQLYSTSDYQAKDLTGIGLAGVDLTEADFVGQRLVSAKLNAATLTRADLTNADLTGIALANANLRQANLTGARVTGTLTRANLSQANLTATDLSGANLTGAALSDAILTDAVVKYANLASTNITLGQLYSTASYRAHDLTGVQFVGNDLSGANLAGQLLASTSFYATKLVGADLTNAILTNAEFVNADLSQANLTGANLIYGTLAFANLSDANLTNANFNGVNFIGTNLAGAEIRGANLSKVQIQTQDPYDSYLCGPKHNGAPCTFSKPILYWGFPAPVVQTIGTGISLAQLVSTASYGAGDLSNTTLMNNNFNGGNFAGFNLTNANFSGTSLTGANFSGADARGAIGLNSFAAPNLIRPDGHIVGLNLSAGQSLSIRDYDGNSAGIIPIKVDQQLATAPGATLRMIFETDAWDSTISLSAGIPVALGGNLELTFATDVNLASQIGRTFDLFDWTGVTPSGAFTLSSPYVWNLSNLYTTGEVTFLAASGLAGDFNGDGAVDAADYTALRSGPNAIYTRAAFNIWKSNYGATLDIGGSSAQSTPNPPSTAVPEPSSLLLIFVGLIALLRARGAQIC